MFRSSADADKCAPSLDLVFDRGRRFVPDSALEGTGFELVWGFPCQVVFFGLLPVLCSEREGPFFIPSPYNQVPGARAMGSRDRNASKAWRLAA